MRKLARDIYLIEGLRISNVYLLVSGGELTLIDAGLDSDADRIISQLREVELNIHKLKMILLTHAHGDHVGCVRKLVSLSGAHVIAHRDEVPYIEKTKSLPSHSFMGRMLNWLSDRIVFRQSGLSVDKVVDDGDEIDVVGGLTAVHTPGHTPGSLSLYNPGLGVLFCGDALFNIHPVTRKPGLQLPLPLVSVDNEQARASVERMSQLEVSILCCGHGEPILSGAVEQIKMLV